MAQSPNDEFVLGDSRSAQHALPTDLPRPPEQQLQVAPKRTVPEEMHKKMKNCRKLPKKLMEDS